MPTMTNETMMAECIRIVNRAFLGMLTTVDKDGCPHSRWMGTASAADGLHKIYTLTAHHSRKLEHLKVNPNVCWVFSDPEYTDVVTLTGKATIHTSPLAAQQIWDRLQDYARTWCMQSLGNEENLNLVTLETQVEKIEYMSPRLKMYKAKMVELTVK